MCVKKSLCQCGEAFDQSLGGTSGALSLGQSLSGPSGSGPSVVAAPGQQLPGGLW